MYPEVTSSYHQPTSSSRVVTSFLCSSYLFLAIWVSGCLSPWFCRYRVRSVLTLLCLCCSLLGWPCPKRWRATGGAGTTVGWVDWAGHGTGNSRPRMRRKESQAAQFSPRNHLVSSYKQQKLPRAPNQPTRSPPGASLAPLLLVHTSLARPRPLSLFASLWPSLPLLHSFAAALLLG